MTMRRLATLLLVAALLGTAAAVAAEPRGDRPAPARIQLDPEGHAKALIERLGIHVDRHDRIHDGWVRVYVNSEEAAKLRGLGQTVEWLADDAPEKARLARERSLQRVTAQRGSIPAQYHTYATLTADLQQIAADHPDITRLVSLGQSVQGRELWMMQITDNPDVEENEPEFSYISSMHGDEVVGKEMLYHLIDYLTDGYGVDTRVTDIVDSTELWIMPSMNPDGTELGQRGNAQFIDLNRNFPDQFDDPVNTPAGRAPETQAIMNWKVGRTIDQSANFHGGAVVANYPFDSNPQGTSTFSPTPAPDHDTFFSLAHTYADNNIPMSQVNGGSFVNGVTNGADWYVINGGMQDWGYVWYGGFEILLELSAQKWPPASLLPGYWDDNLESLLAYMERIHEGVTGLVTDAETGAPIAATIRIDANPFVDYTDPDVGDYHRLLPPGTFTLVVEATGYEPQTFNDVAVTAGPATVVNAALTPLATDLDVAGTNVIDGGDGAIDPGELAELQVTLANRGRSATGVAARLIPTGFDAAVMQDAASYPDIALGQSAMPSGSGFQIEAAPAVPAGRRLGFAVEWQTDQGFGTDGPFFIDVGATDTDSPSSTDVPVTIATVPTTVTSDLTIDGASAVSGITAIRVPVDIAHTYIGDLEITLTSPAGTSVRLHDNSGGSSDDIVGTYGTTLTPAQSLDAFFGEDSAGTWTLTVVDSFNADGGSINAWGLELEGRPADTTTPELRFRDAVRDGAGQVTFQWWSYPTLTSYRVYRSTDPSTAAAFADVTASDVDATDTLFADTTADPINFYLVTGVGPGGEGPKGHFGE